MKIDLFEVFYAPVIVFQKGIDDPYIERLIVSDRWELARSGDWSKAPYSEVVCYLHSMAMARTLTKVWYEIYFWTAAQVIPQIESFIEVPRSLWDNQIKELESLQVWLRNRQIKHWRRMQKEVIQMVKAKEILHIVVREDDTLVAYQKDGCDHFDTVIPFTDIHEVLNESAKVIEQAEQHWEEHGPKNPPAPKKKAKQKTPEPTQTQTPQATSHPKAEELPLLKELETKQKAKESEKEADDQSAEAAATPSRKSKGQKTHRPVKPSDVKPGGEDATSAKNKRYRLADGQGPFETIQQCLDALGYDKDNRPKHNRYPRLSKELQEKIKVEDMSV